MIVDTSRLLTFFMNRYLDMKPERREYWHGPSPSNEEVEERLEHLAGMVLLLLANGKIGRHEVEDIMWVVSEYCHRELGVPSRLDIAHHLAQAARTEPALHLLTRYYRDHFYHALNVCLTGHLLLETDWGFGPLWQHVAQVLRYTERESVQKEKVLRLWYITSLLHDVGYGIEVLKGTQRLLRFFQNSKPLKVFTDDLQGCLDRLSADLAEELWVFRGIEKAGEDHGIIAARHLKGLLEQIAKEEKAKEDMALKPEDYDQAIRAIARHNYRGENKVVFRKEPLAFLLILCDTIQEWDRPRLTYETAPQVMLSWLKQEQPEEVDTGGPLNIMQINVDAPDAGATFRLLPAMHLNVTLRFDQRINENDTIFFVWLDASSNFQRLDFAGLGTNTNIEIEYVNPLVKIRFQSEPQRQFYRLRDAVRETHVGFLEQWFPSSSTTADGSVPAGSATNKAVTYWIKPNNDPSKTLEEHIRLNLRELSRQRPITKDIKEFFKCLMRWRCYNDNRTFIGDYGLPESPY